MSALLFDNVHNIMNDNIHNIHITLNDIIIFLQRKIKKNIFESLRILRMFTIRKLRTIYIFTDSYDAMILFVYIIILLISI